MYNTQYIIQCAYAHTNTQTLEKLGSRKLKINAKETMKIAEKLYTQGFISYPRTETNIFPASFDLGGVVAQQAGDPQWGAFASRLAPPTPRQGSKTDNAHPPIYPVKYTSTLTVSATPPLPGHMTCM